VIGSTLLVQFATLASFGFLSSRLAVIVIVFADGSLALEMA
jgi:hypothetical protein